VTTAQSRTRRRRSPDQKQRGQRYSAALASSHRAGAAQVRALKWLLCTLNVVTCGCGRPRGTMAPMRPRHVIGARAEVPQDTAPLGAHAQPAVLISAPAPRVAERGICLTLRGVLPHDPPPSGARTGSCAARRPRYIDVGSSHERRSAGGQRAARGGRADSLRGRSRQEIRPARSAPRRLARGRQGRGHLDHRPSGSGKSTLLRCFALLEAPSSGRILMEGAVIACAPPDREVERRIRRRRPEIGMVFQDFNLWPHLTALGNIVEAPLRVKGMRRADGRAARQGRAERQARRISRAALRRPAPARGDRARARHESARHAVR
jgi:ABC transporter